MSFFDPQYTPDPDDEEREYEELREPGRYATAAEWRRIMANRPPLTELDVNARQRLLAEAAACTVCGLPVIANGGRRHSSCQPECPKCYRQLDACKCAGEKAKRKAAQLEEEEQ